MEIDFLIIGQGLAGSALGYRLIQQGKKVVLLDLPGKNQSSQVAAGLFNPVTGRKMVKTWKGEVLFPEIAPFYQELEKVTGRKFLTLQPIYRPFLSIEEQNEWMGHSSDPEIQPFLKKIEVESQQHRIKDPFGGVMLQESGWLDIPTLLEGMVSFFGERLQQEEFKEEELIQEGDYWSYAGWKVRAIIYCNGLGALRSRFFSFLPFAPVKGEILEVKQDFSPPYIVNRGVFRVPLPNGNFRVGSTYSWHDLEEGPTETAQKDLLNKLMEVVPVPVEEVVAHRVGIRPATKDRKPFLGKHPLQKNVYIFNGFGAKGVSLVPYFSACMQDFLLEDRPLPAEVSISRYFTYI